jgi:hypothetical protein
LQAEACGTVKKNPAAIKAAGQTEATNYDLHRWFDFLEKWKS